MSLRVAALHLFVLSAFAVAQPLFDLLGRNAEFFGARGSTGVDVVLFALTLLVVPPALLLAVEAIVPRRARSAVHAFFVAALVGLIVLQAIRADGIPRSSPCRARVALRAAAPAARRSRPASPMRTR